MTINVSCGICSEKLDDRDLVKDNILCWKCGWKGEKPLPENKDEIDVWLPYD